MDVTCALIVLTPSKRILLVHPTFGRRVGGWSIPKGIADEGEDLVEAALRELWEETSLDLRDKKAEVIPLGRFPYVKHKDIFYAYYRSPVEIETINLICESCFDHRGTPLPEVDDFTTVLFDDALTFLNVKQADIFRNFREQLT